MKFNSPLPASLPKECQKAAQIFQSFVDHGHNGLDGVIPRSVLTQAKGFAIFTVFKAGFLFSARAGSGIVIGRLDDGSWSAPSAIGTGGLGVGGQAGAEVTDFLVVLNSRSALRSFMAAGNLTLGGNASIAIGPLGRNGEASGALNTKGKAAAMYSYSKTRGLFGGISLEGSAIVERQDANAQAYKSNVTAQMLLSGRVDIPDWAMPLIRTLDRCVGPPGGREWVQDYVNDPASGYSFNGIGSTEPSQRPSFLRKKSRSGSKVSFPPVSWGRETNNGSYFEDSPGTSGPSSGAQSPTTGDHRFGALSLDTLPPEHSFGTRFDSDFTPEYSSKPKHKLNSSWSNSQRNFESPGSNGHYRSFSSPHNSNTASRERDPFEDDSFAPRRSITPPYIAPKPELSEPLQGGVARAIALYRFEAVEPGDLSFNKGDVITVLEKTDKTEDWWRGRLRDRVGIFPANFVEEV